MYFKPFLEVVGAILRFVVQGAFSFPIGSRVLTSRLSRFTIALAPKVRS